MRPAAGVHTFRRVAVVRRSALRRTSRVFVGGVAALVLVVLTALALNLRLAQHVTRVDGVFDGLVGRPAPEAGTTLLLVGTVDEPAGTSPGVAWLPSAPALESVMLVHVLPDGRHVTVDSFEVGRRLAAAVTAAEPRRAVAAVEARSGRRVDHLVAVDWAALQQLADDNGTGLTYRPGSSVSSQQEFLRSVLASALHAEMRQQPWTLYAALDTVARGMAVEAGWSMLSMDLLVLSLCSLRSADVEFRALPPADPDGSSTTAEAGLGLPA